MSNKQNYSEGHSEDYSEECPDLTGEILNGKYLLIIQLGGGSFSSVWLTYDINTKNFYAIKIQNTENYDEGKAEIELLKKLQKLNCPYFIKLIDSFEFDEHICMVLELMAGSLYDIAKKGKYKNGYPVEFVKKTIYQVSCAIDSLHTNVKMMHTDIKPENILLVGVNKNVQKIIDKFNDMNFDKVYLNKKVKNSKKKIFAYDKVKIIKGIKDLLNIKMDDNHADHKELLETDDLFDSNYFIDDRSGSSSISSNHRNSVSRSAINSVYNSSLNMSDNCTQIATKKISINKDDINNIDCIVADEYILNPNIRLADFGNCCSFTNKPEGDIQTRYYRSPEVIMRYPYNEKADVWSIGCITYELLTGKVLFSPQKTKNFSRDRHHIYDIQMKLGPIPSDVLDKCRKIDIFFSKNGTIKGKAIPIRYNPLWIIILELQNLSDDDKQKLNNFILGTMEYKPEKRYSAGNCLNHQWFSSYHSDQTHTLSKDNDDVILPILNLKITKKNPKKRTK